MAMKKTAANFETKFSVRGLESVKAKLTAAGTAVKQSLDKMRNSKGGEALKKSFDGVNKSVERASKVLKGSFTVALKGVGATARTSFAAAKKGIDATTAAAKSSVAALKSMAAAGKGAADRIKGITLKGVGLGLAGAAAGGLVASKVTSAVQDRGNDILATKAEARRLNLSVGAYAGVKRLATDAGTDETQLKSILDKLTEAYGYSNQRFAALDAMARQYRRLSSPLMRDTFLKSIFGEENLEGATRLMNELGKSSATVAMRVRELQSAGGLYNDRDVAVADSLRRANVGLVDAFDRLKLAIFRAFGPTVIRWIKTITSLLDINQGRIVNALIRGYNRFVVLLRDVLKVFVGIDAGFEVQNRWLIKLKEFFTSIPAAIRAGVAWVLSFRDELASLLAWGQQFGRDFWATLQGRDSDVSQRNQWMLELRDQVLQFAGTVMQKFGDIWTYVSGVFAAIAGAWHDVVRGFNAGAFSETEGALYNVAAAVQQVIGYVSELSVQLYRMLALGQDATGQFAWLNQVRDFVVELYGHVVIAIGWFTDLINGMADFLGQFGFDLKSTLLFVGLLNLTGVGGLLAAMLGGLKDIVAFGGPWTKGLAYFGAAVTAFYALFKMSPIDDWVRGVTDAMAKVEENFKKLKKEAEASLDMYGPKAGSITREQAAEMIRDGTWNNGAGRYPGAGSTGTFADKLRPSAPPPIDYSRGVYSRVDPNYNGGFRMPGAGTPVNINLPNGKTIETVATKDTSAEIEAAFRAARVGPR